MKKAHQGLNFIVSVILTLMVIVIVSFMGDFYFDLNDDVLMKDILSGAYTGVPAGHNIQMLYPISAFIALIYRANRGLDWYGIFLCALQFLCVFIMTSRAASMFEDRIAQIITALSVFLFMLGTIGSHFVFVQYTFTVGFMSATAAFLIMTHEGTGKRDHVLAVVLIVLAYLIRSEMLLLTLPIVGVAIFVKWLIQRSNLIEDCKTGIPVSKYGEKKVLFRKYLVLCIFIGLGIIVSQVAHIAAYSSPEWKQFDNLFNARTELYDFQYIPDYAQNKEFFDSIGLSEAEQQLLVNYNYGIDDEINADTLWAVADYASKQKTDETPLLENLKASTISYLYRLRHITYQKSYEYPMTDSPWNIIALALYSITVVIYLLLGTRPQKVAGIFSVILLFACRISVFVTLRWDRKKIARTIAVLILLFACRTSLWMFILLRGRDPIRITHPLYLMETFVLLGMILMMTRNNKWYAYVPLIAIAIASAAFIPNQYSVISDEMAERDVMRAHYDALYDYFAQNEDSFYFVDVYTSVKATDEGERTFSEKMFSRVDNTLANHDLMGGWASKSPLYYDKLEAYGFTSMHDAVLNDGVYVVTKETSGIDWLSDYYLDKGVKTELEQIDTIADVFYVYKVSAVN